MAGAVAMTREVEAKQARSAGREMLGKIPDPFASGGTSAMERKRELTRFTGGKVVVVGKRLAISLERCRYASTNRTRRECVAPLSSDVSSIRSRSQIRDFGGEGVSQSPLKDKVFSTFLDQNPPSELPPKMEFRLRQNCPAQWPVIDNTAIKRLAKGKLPSHRSA